jgi:hypothetical protein
MFTRSSILNHTGFKRTMNTKIQTRSDRLKNEHFSLDQLDLLATRINRSVEMLQMMIDGVAEIDDADARRIEGVLEKPRGYLDGMAILSVDEEKTVNTGDILNSFSDLDLNEYHIQVVKNFIALPERHQKIVADVIIALTETS